jgi:N-methylhydantoinase A
MRRSADLRYLGQGYHLEAPVPGGAIDRRALDGMCEAFHAAHEATYGFRNPGEPIELVNIRVTATGRMDKPAFQATKEGGKDAGIARTGSRDVYSRETGKAEPYVLYDRAKLQAGNEVVGPAIVEQPDSTTVIPSRYRARVDGYLNLLIARA